MQKQYIKVTYRDIAKMMSSALPVEGEEFGLKVAEFLVAQRALGSAVVVMLLLDPLTVLVFEVDGSTGEDGIDFLLAVWTLWHVSPPFRIYVASAPPLW